MLDSTTATNRFEIYNPVIRDGVIAVTPDQMNVFSLRTVLGQQVFIYPMILCAKLVNLDAGGVLGPGRPGQDCERRAWSDLPAGFFTRRAE